MKKLNFWKMSGSGNDFVVMDNRRKVFRPTPSRVAELCDRHEGIGADGLLLLEPSTKAQFRMVYFNSDGSRASMCGNGARCMAWFAQAKGAAGAKFSFETDAGVIQADIHSDKVKITLYDATDFKPRMKVNAGGKTYNVDFINTGVPHAVVFVPDADKIDVQKTGRELRFHKVFGKSGTNVNFVHKIDEHTLRVRTYERGVEDETLACGTGVTAAAIAAVLRGVVKKPIRCKTSGGDVLEVDFVAREGNPSRPATEVTLRGPVRVTFQGEVAV